MQMKVIKFLLNITLISLPFLLRAQSNENAQKIDKLIEPLVKATESLDSTQFFSSYNKFQRLAKKSNDQYLMVSLLNKKSVFYYYQGNYKAAIKCCDSAIKLATLNSFTNALSGFYMNRGAMHYSALQFSEALKDYKQSETLMLKSNSSGIGGLLVNISLLYREIEDIPNAKKYLYRSIPFVKASKDLGGYAIVLNNLGLIFKDEKNFNAADSVFRLGYEHCKKNKLNRDFADVCYNLINNLLKLNKLEEALNLELELLKHVKSLNDPSWEKFILQTIAKTYFELNNINDAKKYLNLSEKIILKNETVDKDELATSLSMADIYFKLKDYKKASETYKHYFNLEDSINVESDYGNVTRLTYSYEKKQDSLNNAKELEISQLEMSHNQEKAEQKLLTQRIFLVFIIVVLIGICVFAIVLYKSNKSKEKANIEITYQKKLISEKNLEITDSINYAKHIQNSLLPSTQILNKALNEYFLIYIPKDIVSGDFYWIKEISENEVLIAVADCTGHGVPGAILSALSIQLLNELTEKFHSPHIILKELNIKLKAQLQQQNENSSRDGLDICLCKYNKSSKQISFSGANRNLWIFNENGFVNEIKATKAGIAGYTANEQEFALYSEEFNKPTFFVLSTDGYADQFGGESNKKITTKQFKHFIAEKSHQNLNQIGENLKEKYLTWKKNYDQTDDVCVIGFKLN